MYALAYKIHVIKRFVVHSRTYVVEQPSQSISELIGIGLETGVHRNGQTFHCHNPNNGLDGVAVEWIGRHRQKHWFARYLTLGLSRLTAYFVLNELHMEGEKMVHIVLLRILQDVLIIT